MSEVIIRVCRIANNIPHRMWYEMKGPEKEESKKKKNGVARLPSCQGAERAHPSAPDKATMEFLGSNMPGTV